MDLKKILHRMSHLKWIVLVLEIALIAYSFIVLPENLIALIGVIIFLAGIFMGLDSLSDLNKMSEKEKSLFRNKKYVKARNALTLAGIFITMIISLLFISLKFFFPSMDPLLSNGFFDLGFDCLALMLGHVCLLKSIHEKDAFVRSEAVG